MSNQSQSQDLARQSQNDGAQRVGAGQGQSMKGGIPPLQNPPQDVAHQRLAQDELEAATGKEAEPAPRQKSVEHPTSDNPNSSDTL